MINSIAKHRKVTVLRATLALTFLALLGAAFVQRAATLKSKVPTEPNARVAAGADVKVIHDNNNVDGGDPTPSFDAKNQPQLESSIAVSPVNHDIVAIAYNDARISYICCGYWIGLSVSRDHGATWFNTMIPGFWTDTSAAGQTSPIKGSFHAADPTVRFDASGNIYVSGLFNKYIPTGGSQARTTGIFLARYDYTPGTPEGTSTLNSAGNPSDFTYARTTVVDWGVRFILPPETHVFGAGQGDDKPWFAIDNDPTSPGFGTIYFAFAIIQIGQIRLVVTRSTDGGLTFETPQSINQKGADGTHLGSWASFAVAKGGRVYVAFRVLSGFANTPSQIQVVRSDDFGKHFSRPVVAAEFISLPGSIIKAAGGIYSFEWIAVDDSDKDLVYVSYPAMSGNPANGDIFVVRSTDGGLTWEAPVKVNDDATNKHQYFSSIAVSNGVLHIAWYDLRQSPNPNDPWSTNDEENVYYAASNFPGMPYPRFTPNVRVTSVGSNPNCQGTSPYGGFIGRDYLEITAYFDGVRHVAHVAWADNRDIPLAKCSTSGPPVPFGDPSGIANANVFTNRIVITP